MPQLITLPSGQTIIQPIDVLPDPKLSMDEMLQQASSVPLQHHAPLFFGYIHGEVNRKKEEIETAIDRGAITPEEGAQQLLITLLEANARLQEENTYVMKIRSILDGVDNPDLKKQIAEQAADEFIKKMQRIYINRC